MSSENSPPPTPSSQAHRRASIASGQKLSELFGRSPCSTNGTSSYPGPIATAAANASAQQRRRTSMAGLGLAGSPTSTSPFANIRTRNSSVGSSSSPNSLIEESAVEEGDAAPNQSPTSLFARRMSFGARALHDIKTGANMVNGEGFNWTEQIRNRAERSASITQRPAPPASAVPQDHYKAAIVAPPERPVKEAPKVPRKPDHFQERILKGDFYMD
ncbi:MAG: hypothetical protein Q9163_001898 [Psora crenata]